MGGSRVLSTKFSWPQEARAAELLDWETHAEDFDRLCEYVIKLLVVRCGVTREELFAVLPESKFRQEVRTAAEMFEERFFSLPMFIYMRLKFVVLPERARQQRPPERI